jgi:carbamoyltransferase
MEAALRGVGLAVRTLAQPAEEIAGLLAEGAVVARFHGAFELGPRALGHRSILYTTAEPSVNRWLNERLNRTEFMPFAPATLAEQAPGCYRGLEAAADAARFMTVTFDCTDAMRRASPGVVHVDGTARPQVVDRETAPDFHGILSAYHRLTGIPSLVNTSFNLHGEPVVASPADAVRSFLEGRLDVLAMDDLAVEHPRRKPAKKD